MRLDMKTPKVSGLILGLIVLALCIQLGGQTITLRLVNGKSGKPVPNKNVTIFYSSKNPTAEQQVRVGPDGLGKFTARSGMESFMLLGGPKDGKILNRIAFIDWNANSGSFVEIKRVVEQGFTFGNECGKTQVVARPGEIIFWAEPIPWWKPDFQ